MANATISQIKVGNITYDIADAEMRAQNDLINCIPNLFHITNYTRTESVSKSIPNNAWTTIDTFYSESNLGTERLWILDVMFSLAGGTKADAWRRGYLLTASASAEASTGWPSHTSVGGNFTQYVQLMYFVTSDVYARLWHNYGSALTGTCRIKALEFKTLTLDDPINPTMNFDFIGTD